MEHRTAIIHKNRMQKITDLIPLQLTDNDLNWIVDWILAVGIGTINAALKSNPKLTLHDLFILTTKLPEDIGH
jgi:hypothetical protein